MTSWTPKLEKLLWKLADREELILLDIIDPDYTGAGATFSIAFNTAVRLNPLANRVCAELGVAGPYENHLPQIIALAEKNDPELAAKLKRNKAASDKVNQIMRYGTPAGALNKVKQQRIKY